MIAEKDSMVEIIDNRKGLNGVFYEIKCKRLSYDMYPI